MFSALSQVSLIHILDKTNGFTYKTGEVIGITQPKFSTNFSTHANIQMFVDIKIKIDGEVNEFNGIPSNYSVVTYNGGKLVLSETKQGLQVEIENIIQNAKQVLASIDTYKQAVADGEKVLKELNPQFAKDKERDEQIDSLKTEMTGMKSTLDKIVSMLSTKKD